MCVSETPLRNHDNELARRKYGEFFSPLGVKKRLSSSTFNYKVKQASIVTSSSAHSTSKDTRTHTHTLNKLQFNLRLSNYSLSLFHILFH